MKTVAGLDSKPRRYWLLLGRWLLGVVGLVVALWLGFRLTQWWLLRSELAAIRARGEPVTLAELALSYPPIPPPENAALIFEQAISLLVTNALTDEFRELFRKKVFQPDLSLSAIERTQADRALLDNRPALDLLPQANASARSRYSFDPLPTNGGRVPSHHGGLRILSELLWLRTRLELEAGHKDEALQTVVTSFALCHSVLDEPTRAAGDTLRLTLRSSLKMVECLLSEGGFTEEQYRRLSQSLESLRMPEMPRRQITGDRCLTIALMGAPETSAQVSLRRRTALHRLLGIWDQEERIYLRWMADDLAATQLPFGERHNQGEKLFEQIAQKHDEDHRREIGFLNLVESHSMATWIAPVTRADHELPMKAQVTLEAALIAMAVDQYRGAHDHRLPGDLAALIPAYLARVPDDPFGQGTYRFLTRGTNYIVYSVGPDGEDNQGVTDNKDGRKMDDIAFTVRLAQ